MTRKRHGANNQHKVKHFSKWLLDTFDITSDDDRPILDIAGGKGELSARLVICARQNVVLVDPRQANVLECFESRVRSKLPKKWQEKMAENCRDDPDYIRKVFDQRFRQIVEPFTYDSIEGYAQLLQQASLLIGLHADSATEVIVDAAIRYQKPFVVVPCCVFPNLFARTHNNQPVRTHEQFCHYLVDKDSRFKLAELPFEGRNTAIYWDGK